MKFELLPNYVVTDENYWYSKENHVSHVPTGLNQKPYYITSKYLTKEFIFSGFPFQ